MADGKMIRTERIRGIARTPARRPLVPLWTVLEVFVAVSYVAEEVYLVASREEGSSDRVYGRVTPTLRSPLKKGQDIHHRDHAPRSRSLPYSPDS